MKVREIDGKTVIVKPKSSSKSTHHTYREGGSEEKTRDHEWKK